MNIFQNKFRKDFEALSREYDSAYGENDRLQEIIQEQLELCAAYLPLVREPLEKLLVSNMINNLTTKALVIKLTGDLQKDFARLTSRINDLEEKYNR